MIRFKNLGARFLIRIDDVHPEMNHQKFDAFINLIESNNIKALLGVIPLNKDRSICRGQLDENFWNKIKNLESRGHLISQHGYTHVYDSKNSGILSINKNSEFAGHSYNIQKEKFLKGLNQLKAKGLEPKIFMAPSHSFDKITLKILKEYNYSITDGYGLWPRMKKEVLMIPQLFAGPRDFFIGLYTFCYHTNTLPENEFKKLANHIKKNKSKYINPNQIQYFVLGSKQYFLLAIDSIFSIAFRIILKFKRDVFKKLVFFNNSKN